MGNVYLLCALIVAILIAIFAPRAGLIMGVALFFLGFAPAGWVLFNRVVLGVQTSESDGMLMTMGVFFLTAPGAMLSVGALMGISMGLDR